MPFAKVHSEKLSAAVVQQIELLILRGILRPGERLPSERDLSEQMGVSRPSLRAAIAEMSDRGLLTSKANSGIFVAGNLGSVFPDALTTLFSRHSEAVFDTLDFRVDMEGLAAERAARLGSDTDLKVIASIFAKMQAAHGRKNPDAEFRLDAEFHIAITEASHNVIMLHMMRSMFQLLQDGVFYNRQLLFRQNTTRQALLDQHHAINDAIQARDPDAARRAVKAHFGYIRQALIDEQAAEKNEVIAKQRLGHEASRP